MRLDLAEDPAVIAMAAALDVDEDLIVGKLHRLWSWADRQSRDGHATGVTQKWIDRFIRLDGFAQAMQSAGWLLIEVTGISFPNFDKHNGETAKTRAEGTKRKQSYRARVANAVPEVSQESGDRNGTREEKRRREAEKPSSTAAQSTGPTDLTQRKAERLAAVCQDAITAFNSILARPKGLLPAVHASVGREKRQKQVGRCLKVAREICQEQYGSTVITPEFWIAYFGECAADEFKSGRQTPGKGHENWTPTFEYLTREAVMLEVFDKAAAA